MSRLKLREALDFRGVSSIDREKCVISGVKVCGVKSANGRRYSRDALQKASKLYEGVRVFFNHPAGDDNARRFQDRFGRLVNVRPADDGGLVSDLRYNPAHADAESFLWLAENDPAGMGLSHNAEGRGRRDDNGDILVEEITRVHSVDIVDGPATTLSLYEQDSMEPLTDPAAGGATGSDGISDKLAELASEITKHPEWDKATKLTKLKALIGMLEDGDADKDDGKEDEMPEPEMMEQLGRFKSRAVKQARARLLRESRRKQAAAAGVKDELLTDVFLEQLTTAPDKVALRLIEDRRKVSSFIKDETPISAPPGGAPLDPKAIAASIWN